MRRATGDFTDAPLVCLYYSVFRVGLAAVVLGFDLQGAITLIAGLLLALVTLFTGYDHVHFFWGPTLQLNKQIGVSVLAGDAGCRGSIGIPSSNTRFARSNSSAGRSSTRSG